MKINLYQNVTWQDAVKDMFCAIDNSDIFYDHIVLVPDRYSLLCERLLLETLPSRALFNVRVKNLTSFSMELLEKLGIKSAEILSSGETLLLTQKAIDNVKDNLSIFKKNKIAFAYEINKLISQLKSSGVAPEDLNENAGGSAGAKYHDLKLIYSEYQKLLNGRLDANERLSLLNKEFKENLLLENTKLYFAGFDAFTKEAYGLISHLISSSREVNFTIAKSLDSGNDYIYDKDIENNIKHLAEDLSISISVFNGKRQMSDPKSGIVRGLYSYGKVRKENNGFYNLYSAFNLSEEVEAVAKLIRYKVFNGLKFKDIQIAISNVDKYETQIENIFERYNIPYYIDSSRSADNTLLGRFVLEFLEGVSYGFSGDRLLNILSNSLIGDNSELIERCERFNIDNKYKYKRFVERDFPFADLAVQIEKCKTGREYGEKVLELIGRVLASFDEVMRRLEDMSEIKEKNINLQVVDILKETIELINKYDEGEIEIDEYIRKLKLLLSFKEVSTVPSYVDGVMIGDATSSFFTETNTLIIMGGQALPQTSQDNGILSDDDLGANLKEIDPTIRMINRRNRFKVFTLLTMATNQLTIFYQLLGDEGKKNSLPSFITCLNDIFGQMELRCGNIFFNRKAKDKELLLLSLDYKKFKKTDDKIEKNIKNNFKNRKLLNFMPDKLMFKEDLVSVSQLEKFYSCPFAHFASYGLRLKEQEIEEFDQRDIGNVCHSGAELFIKSLQKQNYDLKTDIDDFIEKNFDYILDRENLKEKLEVLDEKDAFTRYLKRQIKSNLQNIVRELSKSSFKPKYIEKSFKPFVLNVKDKNYIINGRADRIDECGNYFRIIDYKTGKTGTILKELYYGEKLQLFLYQKIAGLQLNKKSAGGYYFNAKLEYSSNEDDKVILKGIAPNDDEVLSLIDEDFKASGTSNILSLYKNKDGENKGSSICEYKLDQLEEYSVDIARKGIEKIKRGFIRPMPHSNSCKYCKLSSLCGYEKSEGVRKNNSSNVKF